MVVRCVNATYPKLLSVRIGTATKRFVYANRVSRQRRSRSTRTQCIIVLFASSHFQRTAFPPRSGTEEPQIGSASSALTHASQPLKRHLCVADAVWSCLGIRFRMRCCSNPTLGGSVESALAKEAVRIFKLTIVADAIESYLGTCFRRCRRYRQAPSGSARSASEEKDARDGIRSGVLRVQGSCLETRFQTSRRVNRMTGGGAKHALGDAREQGHFLLQKKRNKRKEMPIHS